MSTYFWQNPTASRTKKCEVGTEVQTLLFPKDQFTVAQAKKWAKEHGKHYGKVDSGSGEYHRLRQRDPDDFKSFGTISFGESGIKAVVGCPKRGRESNPKAGGLLDRFMKWLDPRPSVTDQRWITDPHGEKMLVGKQEGEWVYYYDRSWIPLEYYGGPLKKKSIRGSRLVLS